MRLWLVLLQWASYVPEHLLHQMHMTISFVHKINCLELKWSAKEHFGEHTVFVRNECCNVQTVWHKCLSWRSALFSRSESSTWVSASVCTVLVSIYLSTRWCLIGGSVPFLWLTVTMQCSLENEGMRREWWVRDCGGDCESGSKWVNRASSGNMLPPIKRKERIWLYL